ncbi:MAG: T9SS type A sorting domain-containing protein [Bacteroidetes bacterium]|nr:T9SS type A sorting domain-containing protein [Bacteroidota bacterium]
MKKIYFLFSLLSIGFFVRSNAQCTITSGPTVTPNGLSISVTGTGTGAAIPQYVYDWGDATSPGTSQTSTHTYASAGTYALCMYYVDVSNSSCVDTNCTSVTVTATGINTADAISRSFKCVPNPVSSSTQIDYALSMSASVNIRVYDVLGNEVAVLENGTVAAGQHIINWNTDGLSKGVYFIRMQAGDISTTIKVVKQ